MLQLGTGWNMQQMLPGMGLEHAVDATAWSGLEHAVAVTEYGFGRRSRCYSLERMQQMLPEMGLEHAADAIAWSVLEHAAVATGYGFLEHTTE